MKTWQIPVVGILGLGLLVLGVMFVRFVPAIIAFAMVSSIVGGFAMVPDVDFWRAWVTTYDSFEVGDEDVDVHMSNEPIAVRPVMVRIWLLLAPTIIAIGYLIYVSLRGFRRFDPTLLEFHTLSAFPFFGYPLGIAIGAVWLLLSSWVYERWLLRQAAAAQYETNRAEGIAMSYIFEVAGDYYGGWDFPFVRYRRDPALAKLVMYRRSNPERNHIVPAFLFHRFEVIGRGLPDLQTSAAVPSATPAKEDV